MGVGLELLYLVFVLINAGAVLGQRPLQGLRTRAFGIMTKGVKLFFEIGSGLVRTSSNYYLSSSPRPIRFAAGQIGAFFETSSIAPSLSLVAVTA